nr:benzoate/H(+) symporter BenE family transporter [Thalassospira lucentensis]
MEAVAGLALIGAFAVSAVAAFRQEDAREAAAVTFIVTAASLTFYGISGAFWGLLAGGLIYLLTHLRNRKPPTA